MKVLLRTAIIIVTLLGLAVGAAALSNIGLPTESQPLERLSQAEKARLAEMFHLRQTLGDEVWPAWGQTQIPVIAHNEAYAFLVGYPEGEMPPDGWVRVPWDERLGGPWEAVPDGGFQGQPIYRQQLTGPEETPQNFTVRVGDHWAATLWTREYAKISMISGFRGELPTVLRAIVPWRIVWRVLMGATETYVGALAHEAFHAYQGMEAPQRLSAAEFSASAEDRYPWDDEAMEDAWRAELDALHGAAEASSEDEAAELGRRFLALREERRRAHGLSSHLVDYERQQEWLEGLAKYAELSIQRQATLDAGYEPLPVIEDDPDFHAYGDRERYWQSQVDEIRRLSGRSGRTFLPERLRAGCLAGSVHAGLEGAGFLGGRLAGGLARRGA